MMVYCPSCEASCSEKAETCPKCGHPLVAPVAKPVRTATFAPEVQTVEQTSKKWKRLQLIGAGLILASFLACEVREPGDPRLNSIMLFGGIVVWVYGRVSAWWHHG